jgi:Cysteine rich repeat
MIYKWPLFSSMIFACAVVVQVTLATAEERPCRADIEKFCQEVKPGGGRMAECLQKHREELSPACRARGQEMRERIKEAHEACKEDISKYCGEVRPGEGHIAACLRLHDKDLSADCRASMKPAR